MFARVANRVMRLSTAARTINPASHARMTAAAATASATAHTHDLATTTLAVPQRRCFASAGDDDGPLDELVRTFLEPKDFCNTLQANNIDFFTGVPDSLLKDFCGYVTDNAEPNRHVIASNEGASVAIATGYHLATKRFPLVYLQNSGFGNTVNPLLSLVDPQVYSIPMLLMVGWRGEPGKKDEPQHRVQGQLTPALLASMNIPFEVLPDYKEGAEEVVRSAVNIMKERHAPFALLVKRATFQKYSLKNKITADLPLTREDFLRVAVEELGDWDIVVSTTGFTSREVFELREQNGQGHERDFLTVGSMGHSSAISIGIALAKPSRQVVTLDGDGAFIMHMGTVTTAGALGLKNFKHIVINNGAHDSVGAQPTPGFDMDVCGVAKASGYKATFSAETEEDLRVAIRDLMKAEGPALLEARVRPGARKNLGRPTTTTLQNKSDFMAFLDY